MASTIDERIVEMRFDNKQFEQGVKQTVSTLDKLKNALNFTESGKSLDKLEDSVKDFSFEGMASGIEALQKRFSTLGIIGMRVIENLTDSVMNKLGQAFNFVTNSIITGGITRAMNLEKAHFQLQNIIGDEARVQEVMNSANKSVDGTAYSFDVAAKAASQFYASGITDLDNMDKALRGLAGATATFSADYEQMSMIWTQVAGQGRLMGDQLLQLSTRGMNAAVAVTNFMNGINDGSIEASESVTKAVKSVSKATNNTEADIRDFVSKGKINFEIFAEAMSYTFGDAASKANETFDGALANIKSALARIGAGFISPLIAQNSEIVGLFNTIRQKVNEVKSVLVFDEAIGNVGALSKQFTDSVLSMAKSLSNFIENADMTTWTRAFAAGINVVRNVIRGFLSVIAPVGKAFSDVFLAFDATDVLRSAERLAVLTRNFKLSANASKNLKDAFTGIFNVVKLVIDVFLNLIGVTTSVGKPITSIGGAILDVVGALGRGLTGITEWIRACPILNKALSTVGNTVRNVMGWFASFISNTWKFIKSIKDFPITQQVIGALAVALEKLGDVVSPKIEKITKRVREFGEKLSVMIPEKVESAVNKLQSAINDLAESFANLNFENVVEMFRRLTNRVESFLRVIGSNKGVQAFVTHLKEFVIEVKNAFSADTWAGKFEGIGKAFSGLLNFFKFDTIIANLEKFRSFMDGFVNWIKTSIGPAFEGFSVGGAIAGGGGLAMIYAVIKIAKSLEKVASSIKAVPNMLSGISGVLKAYQQDLKASALIKIAGAIGILAAALTFMSFADTSRIMAAATALSIVAGIFLKTAGDFLEAANQSKSATDALYQVGKGIKGALNNLTKAVKWKAIGSALKDFGVAVLAITGSIIAFALMYKKDSASMDKAVETIGLIAAALVTVMGVMTLIGEKLTKGSTNFEKAAFGVLAISLSLGVVISALGKLFKMEFPEDWKRKVTLLAGILGGLAILALAVGGASKIAGGGKLSFAPILALSALLYVTVSALGKLFKMELPYDYEEKIGIIQGIFGALSALMIAMGVSAKLAGGTIKAASTILAICVFIGSIVVALMILQLFQGDKLLKASISLGLVLVALGAALYGAGKVSDPSAAKSVLAMAGMTIAITASLGLLSLVPWTKLLKAAIALGSVLLAISVSLNTAGKIQGNGSWTSIAAMVGTVVVITGSLLILAEQPWEKLLAASTSLSATLLAFGETMRMISKSSGIKPEKITLFLISTLAIIPIGVALYELANQPWENILAAGIALSATLLAFAEMLKMISAMKGIKPEKITLFLISTLAIIPIGVALYELANQPWENMLAAAGALSATLIAFTLAFKVISNSNPNPVGIAAFLAGTAGLALIAYSLYELAKQDWKNLLAAAASVSVVLLAMSAAMLVCSIAGAAAGPALAGILLLDAFIANFALVLLALGKLFENDKIKNLLSGGMEMLSRIGYAIGDFVGSIIGGALAGISSGFGEVGENLAAFMTAAEPFFEGAGKIDESVTNGVKNLAAAMLMLTGASVLDGLTSWLTGGASFVSFGEEIAEFAPYLKTYYDNVSGIDAGIVEASSNAALSLAKMADNLPNSGGLAAKIMGDNSLADFGKELESFGPHIAQYAKDVAGLNPEAVEASANAAQVMSDMADNLPNSGGLAAKIMGDNTLSSFGQELQKFGPMIAAYAASVSGINPDVVTSSASAAMALSELANNLPNSGGMISWFTGDNDIGDFGSGLVKLGTGLSGYYASISSISFDSINNATQSLNTIIQLAKDSAGADASGITKIVNSLNEAGTKGVTQFIQGFQNAGTKVSAAMNTFATSVLSSIEQQNPGFTTKGTASMEAYLTGLKNKLPEATTVAQTLVTRITQVLQQKITEFTTKGTASATGYLQGIKNKYGEAKTVGSTLASNAASGVSSYNSSFTSAGQQAGQGFVNGLNSMLSSATAAGRAIAKAAYDAARAALDEHSPSRKMGEVGEFAGLGFVNKLMEYVSRASDAGEALGEESIKGLSDAISKISDVVDTDFDLSPMIEPRIDLSNVRASTYEIQRMFNDAIQNAAPNVQFALSGVSSAQRTGNVVDNEDEQNGTGAGNTYTFNQYNTSPKALSRIDIYRQTKNEFSRFQEEVESKK